MNKTEMSQKLAKKIDIPQSKAAEAVDAIFDSKPGQGIIAVELDAGREVSIGGFGKFSTKHRAARQGRNPRTGESMTISARTVAVFKPAQALKDRVHD